MQSEAARAIAEQAVVREVILRGWLSAEQVEAARVGAAPGELLPRLRVALAPAQQAALAEVYRAALAQAGAASSPGGGWAGQVASTGGWGAGALAEGGGWGALRSASSASAAAIPPCVGPYAVEQELARGGMGVIMIARHRELGRRVALKLMLPEAHLSEDGLKRFEREAQAVARLGSHPGIVRLFEYGEEGPLRYLAMELVSGGSLHDRLAREGPLPPLEAARLVEQLARTLHVAHAQGVLHRDLKPANVLLDEEGRPKITDFGIAKDLAGHSEQLTKTGATLGTPAFAPPEQVGGAGEVDARSDVYALGATLYALLTGRPPFEGPSVLNVISSVIRDEPRPPSIERARPAPGQGPAALAPVPADLDTICLTCLEKQADERYPSAIALADDLARFVAGEPIAAAPPGIAARLRKWRRRRPIAASLLLALPLVTALVAALAWWGARAPEGASEAQLRALPPVWLEPRDGFATVEEEVVLEGRLPAEAHWVRVWVRGQPKATIASGGSLSYAVPLRPGKNEITLHWAPRGGEEGAPLTRVVERIPTPSWFTALPAARRPPLPLPEGLVYGREPGVYRWTRDGSELVWVPPGTFRMGGEPALVDPTRLPGDHPHEVTLTRGYFIGRYEVTWAQLMAFCQATAREAPARRITFDLRSKPGADAMVYVERPVPFVPREDHPALGVSWSMAADYCAWAGLRLPTEAEWEYAAGGIDGRRFPWGDEPAEGAPNASGLGDAFTHTSPVGAMREDRSPVGCFDMGGNLHEWVHDWLAPLGPEPAEDPKGPATGQRHALRGGAWYLPHMMATVTGRFDLGTDQTQGLAKTGFRVALGHGPTRGATGE